MNILKISLPFIIISQIEGSTCNEYCGSERETVNDTDIKEKVLKYIDQGEEKAIKCLDTSNITNMYSLLNGNPSYGGDERFQSFNTDLNCWDVSKVTDMNSMFYNASAFNNDLSSWDVSSVTSMYVSKRSLEHHLYNCLYYLYIYRYLSFFDSHIFLSLSILLVHVCSCISI